MEWVTPRHLAQRDPAQGFGLTVSTRALSSLDSTLFLLGRSGCMSKQLLSFGAHDDTPADGGLGVF